MKKGDHEWFEERATLHQEARDLLLELRTLEQLADGKPHGTLFAKWGRYNQVMELLKK